MFFKDSILQVAKHSWLRGYANVNISRYFNVYISVNKYLSIDDNGERCIIINTIIIFINFVFLFYFLLSLYFRIEKSRKQTVDQKPSSSLIGFSSVSAQFRFLHDHIMHINNGFNSLIQSIEWINPIPSLSIIILMDWFYPQIKSSLVKIQ